MNYLRTFIVALLCSASLVANSCWAEERPYTDGTVWTVTFVRSKPGMTSTYLRDLANTWRQVMDEARQEQIIVSYKILSGQPSSRDDWDLMLLVESKNWAAFDGIQEKFDRVTEKLVGPESKINELAIKRGDLREILGTRNLQEIDFKQATP
jgi:hypothetical protein